MSYKKISLSMFTVLSLTSLNAYEMKPMGFKATGMGGAGVASSRGSMATYYNPALLGMADYTSEISINAGIGIRENKLVDTVDQLNSLDLSDTIDRIAANAPNSGSNLSADKQNIQDAIEVLNKIPNANGLQVLPSISLTGQFSRYFGIGVYGNADIRAKMVIDKSKLDIIVKDEATSSYYQYDPINDNYIISTENSYKSNSLQYALEGDPTADGDSSTYLNISSMIQTEVPVSFAYPIEKENGLLSLGISIKPMSVQTFSTDMKIDSDSNDIGDEYDKNKKTYSGYGVDLGVAYKEYNTGLILALVGKNINSPSFKTTADGSGRVEEFKLDSFFRAGMSLPVWNDNVEFAIDADLQQSDTSYEGMKSQYVGGGMEFHPASWFALRVGAMKNIASESIDEGMIYTAGLGFGLKWLQFDLSAQASQKTGTYDGNEIPKYANVNFSLISRWGDGYNRKPAPIEEIVPEVKQDDVINNGEPIKTLSPEEQNRIQQDSQKAQKELDQAL
ncbi:MAG: conjugal transfer protein TraF [Arcobacteraceae bacterium]|nr:conjugal transfer protein TraF [Arcobacteraceae bacterium]